MQDLAAFTLALIVITSPALAQKPCDIANGAVRLHMTSQACQLPLSPTGKMALAAARTRPAVMACLEAQFGKIKAELQEAIALGGKSGIGLWCDLQQQTLSGMLE